MGELVQILSLYPSRICRRNSNPDPCFPFLYSQLHYLLLSRSFPIGISRHCSPTKQRNVQHLVVKLLKMGIYAGRFSFLALGGNQIRAYLGHEYDSVGNRFRFRLLLPRHHHPVQDGWWDNESMEGLERKNRQKSMGSNWRTSS